MSSSAMASNNYDEKSKQRTDKARAFVDRADHRVISR